MEQLVEEEEEERIREEEEEEMMMMMMRLPEGCISHVISLTSPRDACRSAAVSTIFRSAAESDTVWEHFLPSDDYLSEQSDSVSSKKDLFFRRCQQPILLDHGKLSLALERTSGARIYMLSARSLSIVWGDTPQHWRWIQLPNSRFSEVAELLNVCWLEVRGKIDSKLLTVKTAYAAYLVFKVNGHGRSFTFQPQETTVMVGNQLSRHTVCLAPDGAETRRNAHMFRSFLNWRGVLTLPQLEESEEEEESVGSARSPQRRDDGWMEMEMGKFYNDSGEDGEIEISLMEIKGGFWKRGLVIEGIEVRPTTKHVPQ